MISKMLSFFLFFYGFYAVAQTDISNCFEPTMEKYAAQLVQEGYTFMGTFPYEVVYYRYGSNYYWKTVHAKKFKSTDGRLVFAKCDGVDGGFSGQRIIGTWKSCFSRSDDGTCSDRASSNSGPGEFNVLVQDISIGLGGAVSYRLTGGYDLSLKGAHCKDSRRPIELAQACRVIQFAPGAFTMSSNQIKNGYSTLQVSEDGILTGVHFLRARKGTYNVSEFLAEAVVKPEFVVRIVDRPLKAGIDFLPKRNIVLGKDFSGALTIRNESSFIIELSGPVISHRIILSPVEGRIFDLAKIPIASETSVLVKVSDADKQTIQIVNKSIP